MEHVSVNTVDVVNLKINGIACLAPAGALYQEDQEMPLRKSHKSPLIQEVYEHYLDQPGSQRAHQLLHTCYTDRSGQHR